MNDLSNFSNKASLFSFSDLEEAHRGPAIFAKNFFFYTLIFLLILITIGGITRLTQSGLSMVEWGPLMDILPPFGTSEWEHKFALYQQYPEYQLINKGMSLEEFKVIYFWEYIHRLIARLLGFWLLGFWSVFILKYGMSNHGFFHRKFFICFILGLSQGLMGWYMVKSGLIHRPSVDHFRLAAHFFLALLILAYCFLNYASLASKTSLLFPAAQGKFSFNIKLAISFIFLLFLLQILYGTFTAGLKAGHGYPTFPTMNQEWIPSTVFATSDWIEATFYHGPFIQFIHRWLGSFFCLTLFFVHFLLPHSEKFYWKIFIALCLGQFLIGVFTILGDIPVTLASFHQLNACFVFLFFLYLLFRWRNMFFLCILFFIHFFPISTSYAFGQKGEKLSQSSPLSASTPLNSLESVRIEEHRGDSLPVNFLFTDHSGKTAPLKEFFIEEKPVLTALIYYSCPSLCNVHLNFLFEKMKEMNLRLGKDYSFIAISIDPKETHDLAQKKRLNLKEEFFSGTLPDSLKEESWEKGVKFLVGTQESIEKISTSLGFFYTFDRPSGEWLHKAVAYTITPAPKFFISDYLYALKPEVNDIENSLLRASTFSIGTFVSHVGLFCSRLSPFNKERGEKVLSFVRLISLFVLIGLGVLIYRSQKVRKN